MCCRSFVCVFFLPFGGWVTLHDLGLYISLVRKSVFTGSDAGRSAVYMSNNCASLWSVCCHKCLECMICSNSHSRPRHGIEGFCKFCFLGLLALWMLVHCAPLLTHLCSAPCLIIVPSDKKRPICNKPNISLVWPLCITPAKPACAYCVCILH